MAVNRYALNVVCLPFHQPGVTSKLGASGRIRTCYGLKEPSALQADAANRIDLACMVHGEGFEPP